MSAYKHVTVRPATAADIAAFSEIERPPTVKAWVGELDGKIIAIGGLAYGKGRWFAFIDLNDEARPYKMHILRAAKRMLAQARRDGIKYIYAESSPVEPKSVAWMTSLGFIIDPRSQQFYRWSANGD